MTCPYTYGTRHMWPCEEYRLPFDDNTELEDEEDKDEPLTTHPLTEDRP